MKNADLAMYQAKQGGSNNFRFSVAPPQASEVFR
jgi:PleD family two-component response regulator